MKLVIETQNEINEKIYKEFSDIGLVFANNMMIMFKNFLSLFYVDEWSLEKNTEVNKYVVEQIYKNDAVDVIRLIRQVENTKELTKSDLILYKKYIDNIINSKIDDIRILSYNEFLSELNNK